MWYKSCLALGFFKRTYNVFQYDLELVSSCIDKSKKYHTVGTIVKFKKIVETAAISHKHIAGVAGLN